MLWIVGRPAALSAILVLLAACGGPERSAEPPKPVEGVIVAIAGDRLTLETSGGERYDFTIADESVPVAHLHEHRIQELPVLITWRREGERRLAITIADAPPGG